MQSYYELEHVPGHRFEFQQRVRTNKSFDLARDRSAARVRQAAKGKENVYVMQRAKSDGELVPPRSVTADLKRHKWRIKESQTLREFPSKHARARAQLEEQLLDLRLVRCRVRSDEALEQRRQQREELLVELLELAAANGLEERAQQREVV